MWFRWLLSICCALILLDTLEIEAWSGHVCTKYMVTYLNELYCHSAKYWWWTGKHTCMEWKNRHKSRMYSMRYCCNGWKHNGDQLCIIRTDAMNVVTNEMGSNILTHPDEKRDILGKHVSLIKRQVQSCGGNLAAKTVITALTSPNYPYMYENNLRCNWTIQASMSYRIAIRIIDIDLERSSNCSRDYLKINLGGNKVLETDRICSKNNTDLIFISRSNKADAIFVTDGSVAKRGFLLQYQAVPICGGGLTAQTWPTSLNSPNYPYQYANNLYCHWTIEARNNYRIGMRITYVDLEENSECSKDYLQIYLGSNPILETSKICRKNNTDVYFLSRSNEADVIFVTDGSTTKTGFSLQYQGVTLVRSCGGNLTAQSRTTSLTSPNYPYLYENNLRCNWTIQASINSRIAIRIIDIDLEQGSYCFLDYLKINLGCNSVGETDKICRKNNTDLIFISRSNKADIIFVKDGSNTKRGFLLQYQAVPSCGGSLTAQTWPISLNSPNYPHQYANNLYCLWTIEAGKNYKIAIRITSIDLEENSECSKDYLQIYLGSNFNLETGKICRKNNTNFYFLSRSNEADVIFVTDGSTTKTGFSLQYQGVSLDQRCVGNLIAQTWTTPLTSPNYPYLYENNLRCNWTLEAPMNTRIAIRITDIDLEQSADCSYDYLKINLGGNNVSETTKICRSTNTDLIFISRANKADVIFVTDGSGTKRGFLLQYKAGIWSCEDGPGDMKCHVDWDTRTQDGSDFVNIPCVEKPIVNLERPEAVTWIASIVVTVVVSLIIVGFYCWCRRRRNQAKREDNRTDLMRSGYDSMEREHASRATTESTMEDNRNNLMRSGHDAMEREHSSRAILDRSVDQEEEGRNSMNEEEDANQSDFVRRNDRYNFTNYGYVEEVLNRASEAHLAASSEDNRDDLMRSEYQSMQIEHYSGATIDTAIAQEEGRTNIMNDEQEADQPDFVSLPRRTIEDILSEMRDHINVSGYNTLYIKRSCIWESALEQFRQERISPADAFIVQFVDDEGNAEGAIDAGGPRREYFQLMMDYLANCSLFEGPSGRKLLSYDVQANKRNEYFYAGMVIGQSILFNGPVPRFLSPLLLDCVILGPENVAGSREDIYDSDWQQLLNEVQTTDCIRDFVLNHNKTMHIAGCLRNERMENRAQLIQDLINYYLAERTRPAFEKFKQGLNSVGVYNYILTYPDQFRELFSKHEPLTAEKMAAMFTINYMHSQEGDNEEVERKTVEFWEIYLCIVQAGGSPINLEDIMMFATGMKEQPYGQSPKIYFSHPYGGNPASKYPCSSTCSCTLYLPLHDTFEEFKESMDFGILNGSEFGRA